MLYVQLSDEIEGMKSKLESEIMQTHESIS